MHMKVGSLTCMVLILIVRPSNTYTVVNLYDSMYRTNAYSRVLRFQWEVLSVYIEQHDNISIYAPYIVYNIDKRNDLTGVFMIRLQL